MIDKEATKQSKNRNHSKHLVLECQKAAARSDLHTGRNGKPIFVVTDHVVSGKVFQTLTCGSEKNEG